MRERADRDLSRPVWALSLIHPHRGVPRAVPLARGPGEQSSPGRGSRGTKSSGRALPFPVAAVSPAPQPLKKGRAMPEFDTDAAIESFWRARARGEWFPDAWRDRLSNDQAYQVLFGIMARRLAAGERQIGW